MKFIEFLGSKSNETYLDEKLKVCEEIDELPRELKNCSCCERHKINFPVLGNPMKSMLFKDNTPKTCRCPCRHNSRIICREWEKIHEVEDLISEEISEDSDSTGSLEDFIVPDEDFTKKERKKLDRALQQFRGKKYIRR